jgi:hypothetical protein
MAADAHHSPSLLFQPATLILLGVLALVTVALLLSGHHGWVGSLVGTVLVAGGMVGLQAVSGGHGHHDHGHQGDHGHHGSHGGHHARH